MVPKTASRWPRSKARKLIECAALATTLVAALAVSAETASAETCKGVTMPPQIRLQDRTLVLNGMGVREATALHVDVYVAGLYLPAPAQDPRAILTNLPESRLVLKMVRDVDRERMSSALREAFTESAGPNMARFEPRVAQLERMIPNLEDGDELIFAYAPGRGLDVMINGRPAGRIEGEDFARTFYAIWLGDHPPNAGLKQGLLGRGGC